MLINWTKGIWGFEIWILCCGRTASTYIVPVSQFNWLNCETWIINTQIQNPVCTPFLSHHLLPSHPSYVKPVSLLFDKKRTEKEKKKKIVDYIHLEKVTMWITAGGYRSNGSHESQQLQVLYFMGKSSAKYASLLIYIRDYQLAEVNS